MKKFTFDYENDILELEDGNPLTRIKLEADEVLELMKVVTKIMGRRVKEWKKKDSFVTGAKRKYQFHMI